MTRSSWLPFRFHRGCRGRLRQSAHAQVGKPVTIVELRTPSPWRTWPKLPEMTPGAWPGISCARRPFSSRSPPWFSF
jgi:hypothetical protein